MTLDTGAPTEMVAQLFGEQVQQLPGVVRVERSDDALADRKSFRVTIRKGDRETRYAVYRLEADLYIRYEGANLDIRVIEETDAARAGSDSRATV